MKTIDLFRIVLGSTVWTLTSADQEQVYNAGSGNETYSPLPMKRGNVEQKNELSKLNLDVTIPIDHELAVSMLTSYTEQIMSITVFTNREGTVSITWKGRLASIKPGDADFTLNFESIFTSLRRPGLRAHFQKSCRHALYGRGCGLSFASFASAATVNAITGTVLSVPEAAALGDGYLTGGMVQAGDGTLSYVIDHTGTNVTLQRLSYALLTQFQDEGAGTAITVYPGCDHSRSTCDTKFANLLNYGGFDWIPDKNPMGGSSIA